MTESSSNGSSSSKIIAVPQRRRTPLPFIILAIIFVVVPFLTWYLTWFGRSLSDDTITAYLNDEQNVRHVQQALTQIEERIEKGDGSVRRWYPRIAELSGSKVTEIRKVAAWVMGQDNKSEEFHAALGKLLADPQPIVRRNAAVQLVRFGDAGGRPELRAILQPYKVTAPADGIISSILKEGGDARENALLARITNGQNQTEELRSPLPGKIMSVTAHEGARVSAGDVILTISPDPDFVYEALRALFVIGEADDLAEVERYAEGVAGMPERVKQQAAQTAKAIRSRLRE
ncbi:MAG TPA: biotin/lipoyl-binding protein [Pyrinomonadaceae bacterium]|nr:biotin/lipoyl-binding protein [Pyrinomonadaceae bacterium]